MMSGHVVLEQVGILYRLDTGGGADGTWVLYRDNPRSEGEVVDIHHTIIAFSVEYGSMQEGLIRVVSMDPEITALRSHIHRRLILPTPPDRSVGKVMMDTYCRFLLHFLDRVVRGEEILSYSPPAAPQAHDASRDARDRAATAALARVKEAQTKNTKADPNIAALRRAEEDAALPRRATGFPSIGPARDAIRRITPPGAPPCDKVTIKRVLQWLERVVDDRLRPP